MPTDGSDPPTPTPASRPTDGGPAPIGDAVQGIRDPAQLEDLLGRCFRPGGDLKPDEVELARAIAREAPVLSEGLIARIRSHAGLLADLVRNPNFSDKQAGDLVDALVGGIERAPHNQTGPSDRTRAKVARWAARALAAYPEAGRDLPDDVEHRLLAIVETPVDELADWGARSPARSAAASALAALASADGPEATRELYDTFVALEDGEDYLPLLATQPNLARELRLDIVAEHPTGPVVKAVAQNEELIGDEAILERALQTTSVEALLALFGDTNREHWEALYGRLLSIDVGTALRVLRHPELREALTPGVFEDAAPYFAEHEPEALIRLLRRVPDLIKPNLSPESFRTLFLELRDDEPEAALELLSTGRELAASAITAEDLAPMTETRGLNVRLHARLMARAMDLDLPAEQTSLGEGILTRGGLTRWLAQESGRENGEELVLTYLEAAEEHTGGRQQEGDRFQQTVATCAMMTFRPSVTFLEEVCDRWPWARRDFARNRTLPEETRAELEGWADAQIGGLESVASGTGSEAALEARREDATGGLALAVALTRDRPGAAVELTARLRELLQAVDGGAEVHDAVRHDLARALLRIDPLVSPDTLTEIVDAVGTGDDDIVHTIASRSAARDELLKRLLLARPQDEKVLEAATRRTELRADPDLREILLSVDDPETLYRMVGDAETADFRRLWLTLRDLDAEKAAEALDEADLEAQRTLYMDDIMPLLRNGSQKVRALATAYSMEVQSGGPPAEEAERDAPTR